jgi:hypothetical protein
MLDFGRPMVAVEAVENSPGPTSRRWSKNWKAGHSRAWQCWTFRARNSAAGFFYSLVEDKGEGKEVTRLSGVGWLQAFQFAALVIVLSMLGRVVSLYVGEAPLVTGVALGLLFAAMLVLFGVVRALLPRMQS